MAESASAEGQNPEEEKRGTNDAKWFGLLFLFSFSL